jgi:FkbM family methyltransferase
MNYIVSLTLGFLNLIDKFLNFFNKKNFINFIFDRIYSQSISEKEINGEKIKFWTPSNYSKFSIDNFIGKEKLLEKFISEIPDKNEVIFWDIGSNLGIYSILCATLKKKIKIVSFECSTSSLLAISKNISLNNLKDRISIFPLGVSEKNHDFLLLKEYYSGLGSQFNALGNDFDLTNTQSNKSTNEYKTFSLSLDNILDQGLLNFPDFIKLDVDGLELEVLNGFKKNINDKKIKGVVMEMKYGPRKVDEKIFDDKKIGDRSNEIYEIMINAGFRSSHLDQGLKKNGQYLDIFTR